MCLIEGNQIITKVLEQLIDVNKVSLDSFLVFIVWTLTKIPQIGDLKVPHVLLIYYLRPIALIWQQQYNNKGFAQGCGSGSGGNGPFSVEAKAEARKIYRFRLHIGYLS